MFTCKKQNKTEKNLVDVVSAAHTYMALVAMLPNWANKHIPVLINLSKASILYLWAFLVYRWFHKFA